MSSLTRTESSSKIPTVSPFENERKAEKSEKDADPKLSSISEILEKALAVLTEVPDIEKTFQALQQSASEKPLLFIKGSYFFLTTYEVAVASALADKWAEKMIKQKKLLAKSSDNATAISICRLASINLIFKLCSDDKLKLYSSEIAAISPIWLHDTGRAYSAKANYGDYKVQYVA